MSIRALDQCPGLIKDWTLIKYYSAQTILKKYNILYASKTKTWLPTVSNSNASNHKHLNINQRALAEAFSFFSFFLLLSYLVPNINSSEMPVSTIKAKWFLTQTENINFHQSCFLVGHVLILCPFSRHNLQAYVLLPEMRSILLVPLGSEFNPVPWGHVLRLWPVWPHILQWRCLETMLLVLLVLDLQQLLLLWPFSPHNPHLKRLSTELLVSSGQ